MGSHLHRRQVALFLFAVLLPSMVLVALGTGIILQDRELAERRLADERVQLVAELRNDLLGRLERAKLEQVAEARAADFPWATRSYRNPAVTLVAPLVGGRFLPPWEAGGGLQEARRRLAEATFADRIRMGERAEFGAQDAIRATRHYEAALASAVHPIQEAYARLLLARGLAGRGLAEHAARHDSILLELPSSVTDENGVPMGFYAAARLVEDTTRHATVRRALTELLAARPWLAPPAAYLLRDIVSRLTPAPRADPLEDAALEAVRAAEWTLALEQALARLALPRGADREGADPLWGFFEEARWFVTTMHAPGDPLEAVVAVSADQALSEAAKTVPGIAAAELVGMGDTDAQPLGSALPRVAVRLVDTETMRRDGETLRTSFYVATLLLVLSVTLFGGYLVWRDVRRELRLAELRSHFVSSVSHELKTPLTSIRMFAELLRDRASPASPRGDEHLDTIVGESERLTRLLNNVLDLSKIEQRQKIYHPRPTSLAEVAERSVRAVQYPIEQDGFVLDLDLDDDMPPVSVDPDAMEQAILNLITNAMKYSGDNRAIGLRVGRANGHAVVAVSDRGMGIAPEELSRVTDTFYRIRSPENELVPGMGLGLTLVQHMVHAHGGRLDIESGPGAGTTVSIRLPLDVGDT